MTQLIKKDQESRQRKERKRIQIERQRNRKMRDFFFDLEIYNIYFSIFQDNYVVLLINLFSINFDFSIF